MSIEHLGNHDTGMVLVRPKADDLAVKLLRQIASTFRREDVKNFLDNRLKRGEDPSIRIIQTARYEIFLHNAKEYGSGAFDAVVKQFQLPKDCKDVVLAYARRQAKRDPRLMKQQKDYKFSNFSIICNYGEAEAQAPHIDLLAPNYQFGVMITDAEPGTLLFETKRVIETGSDLAKLWNEFEGQLVPTNLITFFNCNTQAKKLLKDYGNVLIPEKMLQSIQRGFTTVPVGSLLSLPGSVVHAGPKCKRFRAVLFFSASPIQDASGIVLEYDPDDQYTSVMLMGRLLIMLWDKEGIGYDERHYILEMLVRYIQEASIKRQCDRHFEDGKLKNFIARVEGGKLSQKKLNSYVEKMARSVDLIFNDGDQVSVDDLVVVWDEDGKMYDVIVYQRLSDGKVVLKYPEDGSWEGTKEEDSYSLEMFNKDKLFDGSNGILKDTNGVEIDCRPLIAVPNRKCLISKKRPRKLFDKSEE
eukprot:CAMPEP_0194204944 /NCGR_PEP_ID=MMETSP0156-20130528/4335_1 /TAXON_ID=33649 /ORGANISM="Thalassionema nitzschioides, Strain L26-B" /LENGTH=469 /DNA_ID=CAMNT_0038931091 /DNA_START=44 /DNA_END=1453 /DNA_ORIENTATION=+